MEEFQDYGEIRIWSNRYQALEFIVRCPSLLNNSAILSKILPTGLSNVDYRPLISSALHFIINKPNEKLEKLINETIEKQIGMIHWQNSIRIGIQIRTQDIEKSWLETLVDSYQWPCYSDEVERIVGLDSSRKYVFFITTDSKKAEKFIISKLQLKFPDFKVFATDLPANHIDNYIPDIGESPEITWIRQAKNFLDWYLLTRMHHLVITRSGFAETAARYALVPTSRLLTNRLAQIRGTCPFDDFLEGPLYYLYSALDHDQQYL